jgi:hypothetical protein
MQGQIEMETGMIALEREMAATPQEFMHGLRQAFPDGVDVLGEGRVRAVHGGACLDIAYSVLPPRVIALLRLPRLQVSLCFTAGTPAQQQALLTRMDLAMQRGGG